MSSWDPWPAAQDNDRLVVELAPVRGGAEWRREFGYDTIRIDPSANEVERRALLAHELIHVERGVGYPVATAATMEREEAIVRRETARRLVPPDALRRFVRQASAVDAVTASSVAEEFDVPLPVAEEALRSLSLGSRS